MQERKGKVIELRKRKIFNHHLLGAAHKESAREKSHIQEQSLMSIQPGQGNMAPPRLWASMAFIEGGG
jgi:hypothetical protein